MKKYQSRIPKWHVLETDKIIVCETSQPLISLPDDLNNIVYEPKYAQQNIPGAVSVCRMRKITFDMLNEASKLLPKGYAFKIFDAWRPVAVQKYLFNRYAEKLMLEKGIDAEKANLLAREFVSYPNMDSSRPFVHSTGGAVDLTI